MIIVSKQSPKSETKYSGPGLDSKPLSTIVSSDVRLINLCYLLRSVFAVLLWKINSECITVCKKKLN